MMMMIMMMMMMVGAVVRVPQVHAIHDAAKAASPLGASFRDSFPDPKVHRGRKLPHYIYPRQPQLFHVTWSFRSSGLRADVAANLSEPMPLGLYSAIPDIAAGKVYLLFSYGPLGWKWHRTRALDVLPTVVNRAPCDRGHPCTNLKPFLNDPPRMGSLRCAFLDANGTVATGEDGKPLLSDVIAHSAWLAFPRALVGTCEMPAQFKAWLAAAEEHTVPQIQVLREGDSGGGLADNNNPTTRLFHEVPSRRCPMGFRASAQTKEQCANFCASVKRDAIAAECYMWQWHQASQTCYFARWRYHSNLCRANTSMVVGVRRHESWDAIDTSRALEERRLISFSAPSPVFGDGRFVERVAQWVEYYLLNFPDSHFFVYARGGNGRGGYADKRANSLPASADATAALFPYIQAGVVTIVWVPEDPENVLLDTKQIVQMRNENDYLYRAKHLSKWVCSGVDYDEYIAPTHIAGTPFDDMSLANTSSGKWLFPIERHLRSVGDSCGLLRFLKWPAATPDPGNMVLVDTTEIGTHAVFGKLGKYIVRADAAQVLFTHTPLAFEPDWANLTKVKHAETLLRAGSFVFELLHFRERDWQAALTTGNVARYGATQTVARAIKRRIWIRFNGAR